MMKVNNFLVVSFVTLDTPYEEVLTHYLIPSLERFHIKYYIEKVENRGSWIKNVAYKPQCIGNAFEQYPGQDIVFLDADAEVQQFPYLFNDIPPEFDLACHYLDWDSWYGQKSNVKELLSGTLFLRNNEKTKKLVEEWYTLATSSFEWEQKILAKILEKNPTISIYQLPLSYCYIKTLPNGEEPLVKIENPVILHHQVSRILKKRIQ